jgi:aminoglycoside phosphotransferase (APT) family kinase protein
MKPSIEVDIEDVDALTAYLRASAFLAADETPHIQVLAGGVSNKTVLVQRASGEAWVLKQALPKLRVAADWFCNPDRIQREAEGMRRLHDLAPEGTITRLVAEDFPHFLLVMEAVPEPHANWKTLLLRGEIVPDHFVQFGALLATIHARSRAQRETMAVVFEDRSYFESLRIEPYYAFALANVPEAVFISDLIDATRARRYTVVHGDYSPKNVLVHDGTLILLDHEVIHFGDPAFDLGFSLTHILSKAHHLLPHREALLAMAGLYWDTYRSTLRDLSGGSDCDPDLERYAVLHTLGCLLARVAGRSPLEYLSLQERERQKRAVLAVAAQPPTSIPDLITRFASELNDAHP